MAALVRSLHVTSSRPRFLQTGRVMELHRTIGRMQKFVERKRRSEKTRSTPKYKKQDAAGFPECFVESMTTHFRVFPPYPPHLIRPSLLFRPLRRPGSNSCQRSNPFGSSRTAPSQALPTLRTARQRCLHHQPRALSAPTSPGELWRSTGAKVDESLLHTKYHGDYGPCWKALYTPRPLQLSRPFGF